MPKTIEQAHAVIDRLASEHFYGSVTFQFKDGQVSLIRREETIVPTDDLSKSGDGRTVTSGHERTRPMCG